MFPPLTLLQSPRLPEADGLNTGRGFASFVLSPSGLEGAPW